MQPAGGGFHGQDGPGGGRQASAAAAPAAPPHPPPDPPLSESLGTADTTTAADDDDGSLMATSSGDDTYDGRSSEGTADAETTSGDASMSEGEAAGAADEAGVEGAEVEGGRDGDRHRRRADRARAADLAAAMLVAAAAAGGAGGGLEGAHGDGGGGGGFLLAGGGSDEDDEEAGGGAADLDDLAPGALTDDSGDEAAAIQHHATRPPRPPFSPAGPPLFRTAPGDGAGEAGRGSYVAGPALLHPAAVAASSHFQAADAVAAGSAADLGGDLTPLAGEEDVVLVDRFTVSVWRLPPLPGTPGPRCRPGPQRGAAARPPPPPTNPAPRLLARALYTQVEPYTVARSPDGAALALGGDLGVVALLRLEACPGLPACGLCGRAAARGRGGDGAGGGGGGGGGGAAPPLPPPLTTLPAHLRPTAVAALGGALAAVANNNMVNGLRFGRVGGRLMLVAAVQDRYVYYLDPAGAGPGELGVGGGGGGGGRARGRAGALAIASLGDAAPPSTPAPAPPLATPSHRTRALDAYAATADGGGIVPAGGTRTAVSGPFPRPVNLALPSPDGTCVAVVGDFPAAYVLRAGGPAPYTSREAAVGPGAGGAAEEGGSGDVSHHHHHYHHHPHSPPPGAPRRPAPPGSGALRLPFGVDAPPRLRARLGAGGAGGAGPALAAHPAVTVAVGAQYAAWSPDSSLLAATSDALRAAFVWHVPRGQALLRVEAAGRPLLAATFLPGHPATLAFAEAARRAYCADLRHLPGGLTKLPPVLALPPTPAGAAPCLIPLPRVAGLVATPGGRLLAATRAGLAEWRLLPLGWEPHAPPGGGGGGGAATGAGRAAGAARPPAFRAAACTFLLIAALPPHRRPRLAGSPPGGAGPWSLPGDLVDDILTLASTPLGAWVGVGAVPRAAPPAVPRLLAPPGGATYAAVAAMGMAKGGGAW